jgi:acyl carrier protein
VSLHSNQGVDAVTDLDAILQRAIAKICDIEPERVTPDASLIDLGIDSLSAAEVLVEVEIALGRQLPVDVLRRLDEADTVSAIAAQLASAFGPAASRPS